MIYPPFIHYGSEQEYRDHYRRELLIPKIITHDNIRVYFKPDRFNHAFYKPIGQQGRKVIFDMTRAERIDWVKATLQNPNSELFQGWITAIKQYDSSRRVSVIYGDFVVIIEIKKKNDVDLKGEFITCYLADRSIQKIRNSPKWDISTCLKNLK